MDPNEIKQWLDSLGQSVPDCFTLQQNGSTDLENVFTGSQASSHRSPWVFTCLVVLYAVFSTIGFLLNVAIVVVIVFLMPRLLHNVTNIFVLTLAFSDIFMCAFNMPIQVFYEREQMNWSDLLCRMLFASFALPLYISSFTILLIAIDRYQMIIYPLAARMTRTSALCSVLIAIGLSIISAIPVAVYSHLSTPGNISPDLINSTKYQYCIELWPNNKLRLLYSGWTFTAQFLTPLVITAILYFQIYWRLRRRMVLKRDDDKKKRTNKILMGIVACFAICWTPFAVYSLLLEIGVYLDDSSIAPDKSSPAVSSCESPDANRQSLIPKKHMKLIDLLLKVFAMASACINPLLYGWLNESIRDSIKKAIGQPKEQTHTSYALGPTTRRFGKSNADDSPELDGPAFLLDKTGEAAPETQALNSFTEPPPPYDTLPNVIVHSPKLSRSDEALDRNGAEA